ncbi:MAG: MiaB/RimO family radical SAM methylthiotransferase [Candidatus Sumerlaeia bacterium]|nr:MiaB/RimO family radical SAM methylthiotransferase [Candidatus Sumerlaeia bacterium]
MAQGCLGECSYCQTRLARGELHSYPIDRIIARIKRSVTRDGIKEIWLTAQDTGAYGLDIGTNLIQLLRQITEIKGEFRVRLGMTNPEHLLPILPDLLEVMTDLRFYKFLHLPLQSGSDRVLRAMRRKYTVREYMLIVQAIRNHWREFSLATDIIAGFPAESESDFQETLQILEEIRPAVINRSHYSARPFTPAAEFPQLPSAVISERSRRLSQLVEKLCREDNQRWLGWNGEVLIDMQKEPDSVISRNLAYKPIIIPLQEEPSFNIQCTVKEQQTKAQHQQLRLGEVVRIKVTGMTTFHLIGTVEMPAEICLKSEDQISSSTAHST